jgi:hypothetical protein
MNLSKNDKKSKIDYLCKNCNKEFNSRQSKWYHEKNCKKTQNDKEEYELLEKLMQHIDNMAKTQEKLIKEIDELKKSNNITNTTNNNAKNINNGKIINHVTINAPGHEMMSLTKDDVENFLNENIMSVIAYIEKTNFNKDKQYNHNFCTTNQNGKYLLHYDMESASIKSAKKKYFYEKVINNAIQKIENSYNKHRSKIKKTKQEDYDDIIKRLKEIKNYDFNNKILKSLYDELNLLCYNSRNIVLDTWNNSDLNESGDHKDYSDYFLKIKNVVETYTNISNNIESDSETNST